MTVRDLMAYLATLSPTLVILERRCSDYRLMELASWRQSHGAQHPSDDWWRVTPNQHWDRSGPPLDPARTLDVLIFEGN